MGRCLGRCDLLGQSRPTIGLQNSVLGFSKWMASIQGHLFLILERTLREWGANYMLLTQMCKMKVWEEKQSLEDAILSGAIVAGLAQSHSFLASHFCTQNTFRSNFFSCRVLDMHLFIGLLHMHLYVMWCDVMCKGVSLYPQGEEGFPVDMETIDVGILSPWSLSHPPPTTH